VPLGSIIKEGEAILNNIAVVSKLVLAAFHLARRKVEIIGDKRLGGR
jgi:hypothetical protein